MRRTLLPPVTLLALLLVPPGCDRRAAGAGTSAAGQVEEALAAEGRLASPGTAPLASTSPGRSVVLVVPPARGPSAAVGLPIPDRRHAAGAPAAGWCGESAIQQALLYFGAWVPQQRIHRAGGARTPDLYASDLPVALRHLGLRHERWPWSKKGTAPFLRWVEAALAAGDPVLLGLKIEPTRHPRWALDHFVLAVGHGPQGLQVNTTWGRQAWLSRTQLTRGKRGLVLRNRADRYYGLRLRGLRPPPPGAHPAHLQVERETPSTVHLRVACAGLETGDRYALERRPGPGNTAPGQAVPFRAGGATHTLRVSVPRGQAAYFRCRPLTPPGPPTRPAPGVAELPPAERT